MSELFPPSAFQVIFTDPSRPLIFGGQAVNLWAEIYVATEPALHEFEPFTSKDADIHGDRELAEIFRRRTGWNCRFFSEPRQTAVALRIKPAGAVAYVTEIIRSSDARTVTQRHGLDLNAIFPRTLTESPHEKIRRFAEQQLPLILADG